MVDVEDRPGVLADLTRKIAKAGVDLDLCYIATRNRVVFGAPDLDGAQGRARRDARAPARLVRELAGGLLAVVGQLGERALDGVAE